MGDDLTLVDERLAKNRAAGLQHNHILPLKEP